MSEKEDANEDDLDGPVPRDLKQLSVMKEGFTMYLETMAKSAGDVVKGLVNGFSFVVNNVWASGVPFYNRTRKPPPDEDEYNASRSRLLARRYSESKIIGTCKARDLYMAVKTVGEREHWYFRMERENEDHDTGHTSGIVFLDPYPLRDALAGLPRQSNKEVIVLSATLMYIFVTSSGCIVFCCARRDADGWEEREFPWKERL